VELSENAQKVAGKINFSKTALKILSKRYYLKDGESAYQIMKKLGLGITNEDINKIREGTI